MTIADGLVLLASTKEELRITLGMPKSAPFSTYVDSPLIPFTPRKLFSTGAQGVWYDPSDLSTLFQDYKGTKPVTAIGDPVGLMLDKSKGLELGEEIVVNSQFTEGLNNWSGFGTESTFTPQGDGSYLIDSKSSGTQLMQTLATNIGKTYVVTCKCNNIDVNSRIIIDGDRTNKMVENFKQNEVVEMRLQFIATKTNTQIAFGVGSSEHWSIGTMYIYNISTKEINGNHATQSVSAYRPTYKGLSYDGTDDALNTVINFPLGDFTISIAVDTALLNGRMAVLGNNDSSAISAIFLEANSIDDSVLFYFGDLGIAVPSIQNTGIRVLTITKLENTYSIYVDDVLGESKTVEKSLTLSLTKIGNWLNTRRFKGKIGGVVILNRAVTEIERTQLVDYLANSLEGSL